MRLISRIFIITILTFTSAAVISLLSSTSVRAVGPDLGTDNSVCSGPDCGVSLPNNTVSSNTVKSIMSILFGVIAVLSVVFVAIGGFKYTVSGGDPSGIASAKNTIIYALVGLGVSVSAFILVQFVITSL